MREVSVLVVSGSLRGGSFNSALARAAQKHAPAGINVSVYAELRDVPLFDEDFGIDPGPPAVEELRRQIDEADALLLCTPEYNSSFPGVLKNALDWASLPTGRSVLNGKLVAIAGASPGQLGTARAQSALRQIFVGLNADVVTQPEVMVFRAHERFDEAGNLTDQFSIGLLQGLLNELGARARSPRRG
jgi:chromate reductase